MVLQMSKKNFNNRQSKTSLSTWVLICFSILLFLNTILIGVVAVKLNVVSLFFNLTTFDSFDGSNILIFGVDDTKTSTRADSLMLFHLDSNLDHIGMLSIPRDTYVPIEGHKSARINHAYSYGGRELLVNTAANFLEVPIHHYIKVNMKSLELLVDAIGGMSLTIEKDLKYIDQAGDLIIDIKKGKQRLNGEQVVKYLRFRQDNEGDIGRINRQKKFVISLANHFIKPGNLNDIPTLMKKINEVIDTNLTVKEMVTLSSLFKQAYKKGTISKKTLPGKIKLQDKKYIWKTEPELVKATVEEIFNINQEDTVISLDTIELANNDELININNNQKSANKFVKPIQAEELKFDIGVLESKDQRSNQKNIKRPTPLSLETKIVSNQQIKNQQIDSNQQLKINEKIESVINNQDINKTTEPSFANNDENEKSVVNIAVVENEIEEGLDKDNLDQFTESSNETENKAIQNETDSSNIDDSQNEVLLAIKSNDLSEQIDYGNAMKSLMKTESLDMFAKQEPLTATDIDEEKPIENNKNKINESVSNVTPALDKDNDVEALDKRNNKIDEEKESTFEIGSLFEKIVPPKQAKDSVESDESDQTKQIETQEMPENTIKEELIVIEDVNQNGNIEEKNEINLNETIEEEKESTFEIANLFEKILPTKEVKDSVEFEEAIQKEQQEADTIPDNSIKEALIVSDAVNQEINIVENKQSDKELEHENSRNDQKAILTELDEPSLSVKKMIVEVLNGNGISGEAQYAARFLKTNGVIIKGFADAGHFEYPETLIVDWKGNDVDAIKLAEFFQIDPKNIIKHNKPQKTIDFSLVLGQDWNTIKSSIKTDEI